MRKSQKSREFEAETGFLPSVPSQNLVRIMSGEIRPPARERPVARGARRVVPATRVDSPLRALLRWLISF